ncbi:Na+/H+ antiporter subunit E [uncultured Microbacterium sp.]|uniref:Na+/H+ antiporter subunit E n=1 Tax=uncultured Microbacterium sp. TaxID=191216 RepID=UPI0025F3783F|nr:Na+/H+ antiporter subunit E [uncultured Microbacterium sp.]
MSPHAKRSLWHEIRVQLPFLLWLVVLWMLLWGQFTWLAALTGIAVAVFVTRVFRLPTIELSGRINLWWTAVLVVQFFAAVVHGSLSVAAQVLDPRRQPGAAIIAVHLRYADDLVMTHVAVTASLIPGSLIVEADRDTRTLYLHVIGVRSLADVDRQREGVLRWERRIVRALGSPEQVRELRADDRRAAERRAQGRAAGSVVADAGTGSIRLPEAGRPGAARPGSGRPGSDRPGSGHSGSGEERR